MLVYIPRSYYVLSMVLVELGNRIRECFAFWVALELMTYDPYAANPGGVVLGFHEMPDCRNTRTTKYEIDNNQ